MRVGVGVGVRVGVGVGVGVGVRARVGVAVGVSLECGAQRLVAGEHSGHVRGGDLVRYAGDMGEIRGDIWEIWGEHSGHVRGRDLRRVGVRV